MTIVFDDDTLLATLGDALAPEMVEPGPEALAELHQALESWLADDDNATLAPVIPMFAPRPRSIGWAGIHRLRHPVAAPPGRGGARHQRGGRRRCGHRPSARAGPQRRLRPGAAGDIAGPRIGPGHHRTAADGPGRS